MVEAVDIDNHEVVLAGGERIGFEGLVLASGSRLHAPLEGVDLPGVLDFKSLRTATELIGRVRRGEATSALIVGNGFIGIELSLLLADLGVDVTDDRPPGLGHAPGARPGDLERGRGGPRWPGG